MNCSLVFFIMVLREFFLNCAWTSYTIIHFLCSNKKCFNYHISNSILNCLDYSITSIVFANISIVTLLSKFTTHFCFRHRKGSINHITKQAPYLGIIGQHKTGFMFYAWFFVLFYFVWYFCLIGIFVYPFNNFSFKRKNINLVFRELEIT